MSAMQAILEAIQSGASGEDIGNLAIPESYRAAFVKREEQNMWEGVASEDKDPRQSLHVGEVATPKWPPTRYTWR
jgi:crotonyl-CoA reductase